MAMDNSKTKRIMTKEQKYQDTLDKLMKRGKYEYGTAEYWEKERKAKFIRNARQREEMENRTGLSIIRLWSMAAMTEMPLYKMLSSKPKEQ